MKSIRVLVVEDELIVAQEIEQTLTRLGHRVIGTVASGEQALQALQNETIELVIMDVGIEGNNGMDVANMIWGDYTIPVVFLTALSDAKTLGQAKIAEPYGYVAKPFEDDDLRAVIEIAYNKYSKDSESIIKQAKLSQAFSVLEEALVVINSNYELEFMNEMATMLSGRLVISRNDEVHIGKVIEFYTAHGAAIPLSYFFNQSSEILKEKVSVRFPARQTEILLFAKSQRIWYNNKVVGWVLMLTQGELAMPDNEETKTISPSRHSPIVSCIFAKKAKRYVRVSLNDILWLEAVDNFVIVHTMKEEFVLYITLKGLEEKLPPDDFLKIHRSYIIRLDRISFLEENYVTIHEKVLPVSRTFKKILKQKVFFA
jgi:DNA-binding LytR/AlgR family response regulator